MADRLRGLGLPDTCLTPFKPVPVRTSPNPYPTLTKPLSDPYQTSTAPPGPYSTLTRPIPPPYQTLTGPLPDLHCSPKNLSDPYQVSTRWHLSLSPDGAAETYWVDARNRTGRQDTKISNVRFGSLELKIRPMGFPALPVPKPTSKVNSDNQDEQFLMILILP